MSLSKTIGSSPKTNNVVVRLLLVVALLSGCSRDVETRAPTLRPPDPAEASLLLVTLDTFRADAAGCGGSPVARTPQLDRLARTGIQFETALTTSPLTLPSHATMLTGLYPPDHGARSNTTFRVSPDVPTLTEALAARGFVTGAFIAAVALAEKFGLARGFDVYDDDVSEGGSAFEVAQRPGDVVVGAAVAWADALAANSRRFEWVHLFDAHQPDTSTKERRASVGQDGYLAAVADADAHLGQRLRADALAEHESWVVVVGDHGEALGDHREDTHGLFLYGATMRVPAVVWPAPGGERPGPRRATFRTIDLAATAFALLGFDPSESPGRGTSAFGDETPPAFMETLYPYLHFGWASLAAVTDGRWKYIEAPKPELYDLELDPGETTNVEAEHPETVRRLAELAASLAAGAREETVELDDATREALESLGYLTAVVEAGEGELRDPKDMVRVNELVMSATQASARGDAEAARRLLANALTLDPENKKVHQTMGIVQSVAGRYDLAADWFLRCVELPPDNGDPYPQAQLGVCYLRLGRAEDARRHLEIALSLDDEDATIWSNLGVARRRLGDEAGARQAWVRALEIDPDLKPARDFLEGSRDQAR